MEREPQLSAARIDEEVLDFLTRPAERAAVTFDSSICSRELVE